jgi:hypothetical protein
VDSKWVERLDRLVESSNFVAHRVHAVADRLAAQDRQHPGRRRLEAERKD